MKKIMGGFLSFAMLLAFASCVNGTSPSNPEHGGGTEDAEFTIDGLNGIKHRNSTIEYTGEVVVLDRDLTVYGDNDIPSSSVFYNTEELAPYIMGKYEVTQGLYKAIMKDRTVDLGEEGTKTLSENPSANTSGDRYPVDSVTWFDAVYFCNKLSESVNLEPVYTITVTNVDENGHITAANVNDDTAKNGYRLPTRAEWEFAARGGNPDDENWLYRYAGSNELDGVAVYKAESSAPVGTKDPNLLEIYDMTGNLYEWTMDDTLSDHTGNLIDLGGCYAMSNENKLEVGLYADAPAASIMDTVGIRLVRKYVAVN